MARRMLLLMMLALGLLAVLSIAPTLLDNASRRESDGLRHECKIRLLHVGEALVDYAGEHGGKLPTAGTSGRPVGYDWVTAVKPYLSKRGYPLTSTLHCPCDTKAPLETSFQLNPRASGLSIDTLRREPNLAILIESPSYDAPRSHKNRLTVADLLSLMPKP